MKNLFKKISALLLTAIMVLTMCSTVFAKAVSENDTATVTITGLNKDEKPTVTLYKVVKGNYSEKGFLGTYTKQTNVEIEDLNSPTQAEINTIAQRINSSNEENKIQPFATITAGVSGDTATATVNGAGVYIAIITGATNTVYNPVYIGVSYNKESNLSHEAISAGDLYAGSWVVKKTSPGIKKDITSGTTSDDTIAETDKNTVSVGDVVNYKLTPTVPSYPTNATNKTFFVSDTMSAGLDFNFESLALGAKDKNVTKTLSEDKTTATYKIDDTVIATAVKSGNGFNMNFSYDGLDSLNGDTEKGRMPELTVTYNARVNESAVVGSQGNTNDAKIYFSNKPNNGDTWKDVNNKPDSATGVTNKSDRKTVYSYQIALKKVDATNHDEVLRGAVFGIYSDEDCTNLVDEITTNDKGLAVSTAVAKGTYYVKELVAPDGYSLSTDVKTVTAQWTTATSTVAGETTRTQYTTDVDQSVDGKQVGYIKDGKFYRSNTGIDGADPAYVKSTSTTVATEVSTTVVNGAGTVPTLVTTPVTNTKMSSLPSTGGMGTYLFTIIGVVVMAGAAGAFFISRRKGSEE